MDLRGITRPIGGGVLSLATLYHGVEPKHLAKNETEQRYCVSVHPEDKAAHAHGQDAVPRAWEIRQAVMMQITSGAISVQASGGLVAGGCASVQVITGG